MGEQKSKSSSKTSSSTIANVLIVDDQEADRIAARRLLTRNPQIEDSVEIYQASTIPEALQLIAQYPIEVVLLDKNVGPDPSNLAEDGIESIPEMLKLRPSLRVLVLTASDEEEDQRRAMRLGALAYMIKTDPKEEQQTKVAEAIRQARVAFQQMATERLKDPFPTQTEVKLGGSSPEWTRAVSKARFFAPNDLPVLITGPTGCGKTELARLIHCERQRICPEEAKAFVEINIAAISTELAERELFGNEPGAYTDAKRRTAGYFELADHGTLFLDEIGDADLGLQKKILKVIEDHKFYRLGGSVAIPSRFKVICATHRNLKKMVQEGTFREDLYMRLSTLELAVPPLSERKGDVPDMVRAMLPRVCKLAKVKVEFEELPEEFLNYVVETPFQGNARGIQQFLARLLVLAPEDRQGKKVLTNWRRILEIGMEVPVSAPIRTSLTLRDVLETPYELLGPDFPGMETVMSAIHDRIYLEARQKFQSNIEIAKALKVSPSSVSIKLKQMAASDARFQKGSPGS